MVDENIKINMPLDVKLIIDTLNLNGYDAYIVGGAVRNSLLGIPVKDWDICTDALPKHIIKIFQELGFKVILTGEKHGTVTVLLNDTPYEITTFRIDGEYEDNRHPSEVTFTSSLKEDLSRRDFTINAMAYNDEEGLIDYFGGMLDLEGKIIRCVGNADDRFDEDNLRRLRAVRFACQLGFKIDNSTLDALIKNPQRILLLSNERIRDELCKILLSSNSFWGIQEFWLLDIMKYIIPELEDCCGFDQFNSHHDKDVFKHILSVVENTPQKLELRLSALLHDVGKPKCFSLNNEGVGHFYEHAKLSADMTREILTRLRFNNRTIDNVSKLVYNHMTPTDLNNKSIKKLIQRVGENNIYNLIELMIADRKGMAKEYQVYDDILVLKTKIDEILYEKQPMTVRDLDINGHDLIKLGYQGKEIGNILNKLLDRVLEMPELNNKDKLIELIND